MTIVINLASYSSP